MCGIAGILSLKAEAASPHRLAAMIAQLRHRGPDGVGYYTDGPAGLAHARLSIIDLEGGAQPIHNEDRSVWVVFNGEIFNYLELRNGLEARGHHFYTHSDTEVIVHLYEEQGERLLEQLNGQFAIALWDSRRQSLLLARDRVGIAPLYWTRHQGDLLFGSEVKSILAAMEEAPRLNLRALDQIFTFWSAVAPETLFDGIYELPPGHWLRVVDGGVEEGQWWDFRFPVDGEFDRRTEEALAEELHARLEQACRLRLRADVPVGAYLSGGLDSSVIAALIHGIQPQALRTFSIGFESARLDEGTFQQAMVSHLGTDHHGFVCDHAAVAEQLSTTVWHGETTLLRAAPVPMRLLSARVRAQGYRVVLTGEGADEVFGGYDLFKEAKVRRFWAQQRHSAWRPHLLQRLYPYLDLARGGAYLRHIFAQGLESPDAPWFSHLPRWSLTAQAKQFYAQETTERLAEQPSPLERLATTLPKEFGAWHAFNRAQYLEAKLLMAGYLLSAQGDRMLMANGVEGRFPYLDHEVIDFAARLPPALKMKVLREKYLLRKAMASRLPPQIAERVKQPYRAPDTEALVAGERDILRHVERSVVRDYGYFDSQKVELLVQKAMRGGAAGQRDSMALLGVLSTQLWHYHFIKRFRENFGKDNATYLPSKEAR